MKSLTVKQNAFHIHFFSFSSFFCIKFPSDFILLPPEEFILIYLASRFQAMNSLGLCLFEKVFTMLQFLKDTFTRYRNLVDSYYCVFQHFKHFKLIHCLLSYKIFDEKSGGFLTSFLLYVMLHPFHHRLSSTFSSLVLVV